MSNAAGNIFAHFCCHSWGLVRILGGQKACPDWRGICGFKHRSICCMGHKDFGRYYDSSGISLITFWLFFLFIYIFIFPLCCILASFLASLLPTVVAHDYKFNKSMLFPEFYGSSAGNIGINMRLTRSLFEKGA